MNRKKIKVSVAMATYNGEKYIKEQIISILNNLKENDELIISDDGSTDKTLSIIKSFKDKRIRVLNGPHNGVKQNFANAIRNTTGNYIFLSDQDDYWYDNKISEVLKEFEQKKVLLVQHDAVVIDEFEKVMYKSFLEHRNVKRGLLHNIIKNSYHGCCIAFDSSIICKILPIPNDIYMHDQWIGLIAELNGKTSFLNKKLMNYRRHSENVSSFNHFPIHVMIKHRLLIIKNLLKYKFR